MSGRFLVGCLLTVLLVLSGCGTPSAGAPVTAPATPTTESTAPPRFAPSVREPKDARGIEPCALLTEDQMRELGFRPDAGQPGKAGAALTCSWRTDRPGQPAGLQINTDSTLPALDVIHAVRDSFAVFEPMEVAGHPAIRGDDGDGSGCVIYTAVADHQGLATGTGIGVGGQADPCAGSIRMAELILSNLPPLR